MSLDVRFLFRNRLGCLGSIIVSVIGTLILLAVLRGCRLVLTNLANFTSCVFRAPTEYFRPDF